MNSKHFLIPLLAAFSPLPALSQDSTENVAEAETLAPIPDMSEIEEAYARGDFIFVREGLRQQATRVGAPLAQFRYAVVLIEGHGGPRDVKQAAEWLQKAVDQDHLEAATMLARLYLTGGNDIARDPEKAATLLARAATRGHSEAQYYLGILYQSGAGVAQDDTEAFNWFLASAEQQYVEAKYELSRAYSRGLGTQENPEKALVWLTSAAGDGHTKSQLFLANALDAGQGAPQNKAEALNWYRRAAEGGQILAQRVLGTKYLRGDGVEKNYDEALRWLRPAAEAGEPGAQNNLGLAYASGLGVEQDDAQAAHWFGLASDAGLIRATLVLAKFYEEGRGVEPNLKTAVGLYSQLSRSGNQVAEQRLGVLASTGALDGMVAPQQTAGWVAAAARGGDETALAWLQTQAQAGMRQAQGQLGSLYLEQDGKLGEAAVLLSSAAEAGDVASQFRLGQLHTTGEGVELDYVIAYKWLNIAAALGHDEAATTRDVIVNLMTPEQISEGQTQTRQHFDADAARAPNTVQTIQATE